MHLRYSLIQAGLNGVLLNSSQDMAVLGVTYQKVTPQTISEEVWYWNCQNIPRELPSHITELSVNPYDVVGYGLTKADADQIAALASEV